MTDWRAETRKAAVKAGIDANLFERQINQESGFDENVIYGRKQSSAGALGIAQFMPQTAAGLGINPLKPHEALAGAARLMSTYLKKYGNVEDALTAYNAGPGYVGRPLPAETRAYIAAVAGKGAAGGTAKGSSTQPGISMVPTQQTTFDQAGYQDAMRKAIVGRLIAGQGGQHDNPLFASGVLSTNNPDPANYTSTQTVDTPTLSSNVVRTQPSAQASGVTGQFTVAKGAMRPRTELSGVTQNFFSNVAGHAGRPITVTTGTNHDRLTVDGNVSDHFDGHAGDFAVQVDSSAGDNLAAHALQAAGVGWGQAIRMARKGGLWSITPTQGEFKGRRIQVIWRTNQGGNHHNHVHIGIR